MLAGLDFLRSPAHDDVSAALAVALARKAEVTEGTSQSHVAERLDGVAAFEGCASVPEKAMASHSSTLA